MIFKDPGKECPIIKFHFANEEAEIQMSQKDWNGRMLEERKSGFWHQAAKVLDPAPQILVGLDYIPQFLSLYRSYNNTFLRGLAHLRR